VEPIRGLRSNSKMAATIKVGWESKIFGQGGNLPEWSLLWATTLTVSFQPLTTNIRLVVMTNTLAYYASKLITKVKCFKVQDQKKMANFVIDEKISKAKGIIMSTCIQNKFKK
jgi:hypothetical protein